MISEKTKEMIARALEEDVGPGDVTTKAIIRDDVPGRGRVISRSSGVVAGSAAFIAVYEILDPRVRCQVLRIDGSTVRRDDEIMTVEGPVPSILTGERLALNLYCRLSGIATCTRRFVDAVSGYPVDIMDTRKTTPGWRELEREAVEAGGGKNHRMGLYDMVLIKDNHIAAAGGVRRAMEAVRASINDSILIEVETQNLSEVAEALDCKADIIMLDNMSPAVMHEAVRMIGTKAIIEASGNVDLETIDDIARTGVHRISIGALTHSAGVFDLSLEMDPIQNI